METTARNSTISIQTMVDCEKLEHHYTGNGMNVKISNNAGTSFCNTLYFYGLNYISANNLPTQLVFIHIPFERNLSDPDKFYRCFLDAVEQLKVKGVEFLWKR